MPSGIYKHKSGKEASAYIDGRCSSRIYYCIEPICNNRISYENHRNGNKKCKPCAGRIHSKRQKGIKNSFYGKKHTFKYKQERSLSQGGTGIPYENAKYPEAFYQTKDQIKERDNYTCQNCNMTEEEHIIVFGQVLHIHHIDYNKKNNILINLITLCRGCHIRTNFNRKYWKFFYNARAK